MNYIWNLGPVEYQSPHKTFNDFQSTAVLVSRLLGPESEKNLDNNGKFY